MQFNPLQSFKNFWSDSKHIASVSYKPDMQAFTRTLKIVLIGVMILGALGYLIATIVSLITTTF